MSDVTSSKQPYDYTAAGYDGFFRRKLGSSNQAQTLRELGNSVSQSFRFDDQQLSGAVGDTMTVGTITIDGKTGRISIFDSQGNEVTRIGELGD